MTEQNALDIQIDGDHYKKLRLQPIELTYLVGGTPCFCKLAKYGSREKADRSIDLKKALHCINLEKDMYLKYPDLYKQNYPSKTPTESDMGNAWIHIFTEDELLRNALIYMLRGNWSVAAGFITKMIERNEQ